MSPAKRWNSPLKIWFKTDRRLNSDSADADPDSTAAKLFQTGVRAPSDVRDISYPTATPEEEVLRQLQFPIQLMISLLMTKLISPCQGIDVTFHTTLSFEQPQSEQEANVLFLDTCMVGNLDQMLSAAMPEPVKALVNRREAITEEFLVTPFALIKLYSTENEIVGAVILFIYSSRIFERECKELIATRSHDKTNSTIEQIIKEHNKGVVESIQYPRARIRRQPEDSEFWLVADEMPKRPWPKDLSASEALKRADFVVFSAPFWIEELRYLRELAYIFASLLLTLTGREACSGFVAEINRGDLRHGLEQWLDPVRGNCNFAVEIEKAIACFKAAYRELGYAIGLAPPSLFLATQRRQWRLWEIGAFFFHWHLFDTSEGVADLINRELRLVEDLQLCRSRVGEKTMKSPLAAAFLNEYLDSGRRPA